MGVVYEAEHVQLGRRVAVKVLSRGLVDDPTAIEMFRREARTTSRLGNPHIVDVNDLTVLPDGRLMFAMELLHGPTLLEEIERGEVELPRVFAILRQLCKGLAAAHGAGVVHRDIKPENIVLVERADARADAVKILDFGIAVIEGANPARRLAGTPAYLAPELIAGGDGDHRVDMYSVGCVAFELLTGKPPFAAGNHLSVLRSHVQTQPTLPENGRRVPKALEQVVLRCLAKDPADRFVDMDDLEAALCEAQVAAHVVTEWGDLPLPSGIEPQRRRWLEGRMPGRRRALRWRGAAIATVAVAGAALAALAVQPPDASTLHKGVAPQLHLLSAVEVETVFRDRPHRLRPRARHRRHLPARNPSRRPHRRNRHCHPAAPDPAAPSPRRPRPSQTGPRKNPSASEQRTTSSSPPGPARDTARASSSSEDQGEPDLRRP